MPTISIISTPLAQTQKIMLATHLAEDLVSLTKCHADDVHIRFQAIAPADYFIGTMSVDAARNFNREAASRVEMRLSWFPKDDATTQIVTSALMKSAAEILELPLAQIEIGTEVIHAGNYAIGGEALPVLPKTGPAKNVPDFRGIRAWSARVG